MSSLLPRRLAAALLLLTIPSVSQAVGWFDDFTDGDATDGSPLTWTYNETPLTPGIYSATTGDFILSSPGGGSDNNLNLGASVDVTFTNTYVRTQALAQAAPGEPGTGGNVGVLARFNPGALSGYAAILDHNQLFSLLRLDFGMPTILASGTVSGVDAATDALIELNVVGSQLDLYLWKPGTPKPATPTASASDAVYSGGRAGILYNEDNDNTAGVFRFVAANDAPFTGAVTGDFDLNGAVNGADFLLWQRTLGSTTQLAADGNGSGKIDAGDLDLWRSGFGSTVPAPPISAVPEPSGLLLTAFGAALLLTRRVIRR